MREIPVGTHIRVTGICMLTDANPFNGEVPFNILMRNVDDIVVVARPPWLNVRHLMLIVGLLLCVVIAIGVRSWALERRIRHKTATLAYLEQRRSRILEDINNSRPLGEIIEYITEVVSFRLARRGLLVRDRRWSAASASVRQNLPSQRIIQQEIPGRSEPPWERSSPPCTGSPSLQRGRVGCARPRSRLWRRWRSKPRASTPTLCTVRSSICSPTFPIASRWRSNWRDDL